MSRLYPAMQILTFSTLLYLSLYSSTVEGVKCDPKQHKYFHPQAKICMDCEKCNPGNEKIPIQEWQFPYDNINGPTECRRCTTCKEGTFSRGRAFVCQKCRKCSKEEVKIQNCTSSTDTVCTADKHRNINTTTTTKATTTTTIEKSSISMTTLDSRSEKQQLEKENSKRTQHLVIGFGSGISIVVVGICVLLCLCKYLTYCGFRWKEKLQSCSTKSKVNQMEEADEESGPVAIQSGTVNTTIVNQAGTINFYADASSLNRENGSSHDVGNASNCPLSMDPIAQAKSFRIETGGIMATEATESDRDSVCTSIDENEKKIKNPNVRYQKLPQSTSQLYKGPRVEAEHEPLLTEMNETIKEETQVEHKCRGTPGIF